ncbi:60S ribosomal protein L13 [Tulasnella sp. 417]|nr:60S ribosomal protein L13 [Tulasnella sp. 417]
MGNFHNNPLPNNHFRKDWQERVKTWFSQPKRKERRHRNRVRRAAALGARPTKSLRPAVHCSSVRYNMKVREGYGFTLTELKQAGIKKREARGLGIKVDYRRRNLSEEGLKANVDRLKEYKGRIIVFPKRTRRSVLLKKEGKADDTGKDKRFTRSDVPVKQVDPSTYTRSAVPLPAPVHEPPRAITADDKSVNAYETLRAAWQWEKDANKRIQAAKKTDEQ